MKTIKLSVDYYDGVNDICSYVLYEWSGKDFIEKSLFKKRWYVEVDE